MPGPIGNLEDKTIEVVSRMDWFKNITFGQIIVLLFMGAGFASVYYMVPIHLKQIQDGYERIEKTHMETDAAKEAARLLVAKAAHEKGDEQAKTWQENITKQWQKNDEKDQLIRELIQQGKAVKAAAARVAPNDPGGSDCIEPEFTSEPNNGPPGI